MRGGRVRVLQRHEQASRSGGWRRDRTPPPPPLQLRVLVLTLSEPDSEDTEEDEEEEECCWGLGMDMGESALCGDAESLCCSSEPALGPTTAHGSCSGPLGGGTNKRGKKKVPVVPVLVPLWTTFEDKLPLLSVLPPHFLMIHSL